MILRGRVLGCRGRCTLVLCCLFREDGRLQNVSRVQNDSKGWDGLSAHRVGGRGRIHAVEVPAFRSCANRIYLALGAKDTRLYSPFFVGFTVRTTFELDRLCRMHRMPAMSIIMSMINTPIARMTVCGLQECEPERKEPRKSVFARNVTRGVQ